MLAVYFFGVNIERNDINKGLSEGTLLSYSRGVFIENVFHSEHPLNQAQHFKKIQQIKETIDSLAPWIVGYSIPNSKMIGASAYYHSPNALGRIYIDGRGSGRSSQLGSEFESKLVEMGILNQQEVGLINLTLTVERIRTKVPVSDEDSIKSHLPSDYVNTNPNFLKFVDGDFSTESLDKCMISRATPARTLIDICRFDENDEHSLNTPDMIDLCSYCGISFCEETKPQDLGLLKELSKEPYVTKQSLLRLQRRLEPLFNGEPQVEEVNDSLKLARINYHVDNSTEIYNVLHYHNHVANIINIGKQGWAVRGEGWLLPLDPSNTRMPPLITSLMPEIVKIKDNEYSNFFKKSPRFMSNIQILEDGAEPHLLDYHDHYLNYDEEVFEGRLTGIPIFDDNFDFSNQKLALSDYVPRVSGCQLKIPMHLTRENGVEILEFADNKPFTHLLKISSTQDQDLVVGEWFGMHISKGIASETADFQLVDLSNENGKRIGYITERFDITHRGSQEQLIACDMCALFGTDTEHKYSYDLETVVETIKEFSSDWERDRVAFTKMLVTSLISDNTDMHLKNISMIKNDKGNFRLSPVYDNVVTSVLPSFAHGKQALKMNGNDEPNLNDLREFCQDHLQVEEWELDGYLNAACETTTKKIGELSQCMPSIIQNTPQYLAAFERCKEMVQDRVLQFNPELQDDLVCSTKRAF